MKKPVHLLIASLAFSTLGYSQSGDWSAAPYASHSLLFGDTDFNHPTKSLNPGAGFALQYGAFENVKLYGDFAFSSANGGNTAFYYESQFLTGMLGVQYDVLGLFGDYKLELNLDGGIGWAYFQAYGFDATTNQLTAKVPAEGAYSNAPLLMLGGNISYALNNQVDVFVSYRTFAAYDNDWLDAKGSGESYDFIGQVSVGMRFLLNGHEPMAKVTQDEYSDLEAAKRQAERQRDEAQEELETSRARYDAQIEDMYNVLSVMSNNIDSLNDKITVLRSSPQNGSGNSPYQEYSVDGADANTPDATNAKWRIVIGSYPTAAMAREFSDRHPVAGGNYEVVYITDLNTYRVVYDSYETLAQAKQSLAEVRHTIGEAWIIKF